MRRHSNKPMNDSESRHDKGPFLFLADLLALDLVNTEIVVRGKSRDLLASPADAIRWWEIARRRYPEMEAPGESGAALSDPVVFEELKRLRAALRRIFSAIVEGVAPPVEEVAWLNAVLISGHHAIEVTPSGDILPVYKTSGRTGGHILFPIALSVVTWLNTGDRGRLHRCANERCVLLFYDTTKSATRRWCSITCMDRARSALRYQRLKQGAHQRQ